MTGAAVSSETALTTGTNELYTVGLGTSGTLYIAGLPFFLQNSVLFDLNGQAIGYTSNFVTDVPIVTPLNVTSASVPLGLAGVISGPGGVFIEAGGSATLSVDNTYTGPTVVSAGGQLFVVGPGLIAHSSGLTVDQGGVVGGTGILPTSVINGTLSPGSFGTQHGEGQPRLRIDRDRIWSKSRPPRWTTLASAERRRSPAPPSRHSGPTPTSEALHHPARGRRAERHPVRCAVTINLPANFDVSLSYTDTDVGLDLFAHLGRDAYLPRSHTEIAAALNTFFNTRGDLPANFAACSISPAPIS